jgi:hypothetical protein
MLETSDQIIKRDQSGIRRFQRWEIAMFLYEIALTLTVYAIRVIPDVVTNLKNLTAWEWSAFFISIVFSGLGLWLSIKAFRQKKMFHGKQAMALLFLSNLTSNTLTLIHDAMSKSDLTADIIIVLFSLLMTILIVKELTSLYAAKVTKTLQVFSIVDLCSTIFLLVAYLVILIVHYSQDYYAGLAYLLTWISLLMFLGVPSLAFYFYPRAIDCDYELQDEMTRLAAFEKEEPQGKNDTK